MYGESLVNEILNKYEWQNDLQDALISSLKENLFILLNIFNNQWKMEFQTAKHLLIILNKIINAQKKTDLTLTLEESKEFTALAAMFQNHEFLNTVQQIYLIINDNRLLCGPPLVEMQHVFSGACFALAASYEGAINEKILFLQRKRGSDNFSDELQKLQEKAVAAEKITTLTKDICNRYRLRM